jgi:hypothetical protein
VSSIKQPYYLKLTLLSDESPKNCSDEMALALPNFFCASLPTEVEEEEGASVLEAGRSSDMWLLEDGCLLSGSNEPHPLLLYRSRLVLPSRNIASRLLFSLGLLLYLPQ